MILPWHERLFTVLNELGFSSCNSEFDAEMMPNGNICECTAVHVDGLVLVMKNPEGFTALLEHEHKFKFQDSGPISCHPGMSFERKSDHTLKCIPANPTQKMIGVYERIFGEKPFQKCLSQLESRQCIRIPIQTPNSSESPDQQFNWINCHLPNTNGGHQNVV